MRRIDAAFSGTGRPAFIGFTVAGDPDKATCIRAAMALIDGGADILELGIPFTDPVADGPTIQKADERSLLAGTKVDTVFEIVREIRKQSEVPVVFLAYYNTVFHRGIDRFYREAREAGVDGILVADMPVEESDEVYKAALRHYIDPIFLITPTTSNERIARIASRARGYLYLVAALGVTGVRDTVSPDALDLVRRVRKYTTIPLALGFGISTPSHAATCARAGADGIIVGSAIVDRIEKSLGDPEKMERDLRAYAASMKRAL